MRAWLFCRMRHTRHPPCLSLSLLLHTLSLPPSLSLPLCLSLSLSLTDHEGVAVLKDAAHAAHVLHRVLEEHLV